MLPQRISSLLHPQQWVGRLIRTLRTSMQISKEKFELKLDVSKFTKEEIKVKASQDVVCIEGKQERKIKQGYIVRQFVKKFKLPAHCDISKLESKISQDGILTISGPRVKPISITPSSGKLVPINYSGPDGKNEDHMVSPAVGCDNTFCQNYLNPAKPK